MSDNSAIEWTDATWNPVRGCTKISPGCANCYAETFAERFRGVKGHPYEQGFDLRLVPEKLTEPLKWKKPQRIFVNSMSDLCHEDVPDEFIDKVFAVMALAPRHTFQILTKRPERMHTWFEDSGYDAVRVTMQYPEFIPENGGAYPRWPAAWPLPNVWLGVSVENQHRKSRIDILRETPAAVRFLSIEPLLEDIGTLDLRGIHWVIVGGESGHGARPFNVDWARKIIVQCQAAGVPCFVKQLGAKPFIGERPYMEMTIGQTSLSLHDKKGGDMSEWTEDLRVREFPNRWSQS